MKRFAAVSREQGSRRVSPEPWEAITAAENVLRDLIEETLRDEFGEDWLDNSGLTRDRIEKLRETRDEEAKRRDGGEVNPRLIYYSNLWDLAKILDKNWSLFADCFGDRGTTRVYLDRLTAFRNPEMHGRDLLPFERHLVLGITGEIRNKVTIYRSERRAEKEFFPRIEYAADSFGNVASREDGSLVANTNLIVHPGDEVIFELRAWDPEGLPWSWKVITSGFSAVDIEGDQITWRVESKNIADPASVTVYLHGGRDYHRRQGAGEGWDDTVTFTYRVLPGHQGA